MGAAAKTEPEQRGPIIIFTLSTLINFCAAVVAFILSHWSSS